MIRSAENEAVKLVLLDTKITQLFENNPAKKLDELKFRQNQLLSEMQTLFSKLKSTKFTSQVGASYGRLHSELARIKKSIEVLQCFVRYCGFADS